MANLQIIVIKRPLIISQYGDQVSVDLNMPGFSVSMSGPSDYPQQGYPPPHSYPSPQGYPAPQGYSTTTTTTTTTTHQGYAPSTIPTYSPSPMPQQRDATEEDVREILRQVNAVFFLFLRY